MFDMSALRIPCSVDPDEDRISFLDFGDGRVQVVIVHTTETEGILEQSVVIEPDDARDLIRWLEEFLDD